MSKKFAPLLALFALVALSACTSTRVIPVKTTAQLNHTCIKENTAVKVDDFLYVLQNAFEKHGITTEVFKGKTPQDCEYVTTYTALRSWDMATYLSHAEIYMRDKSGRQVAFGEYHLKGKGGLSLTKWGGTQGKIEPVIDQMLKNYNP